MTEARLEIKPTVSGDVRRELAPINRELQRFERQQERAMSRAERNARRLERAYDSIGHGLGRASRGLGSFTRGLFSLQSIAVGAATGFAGRTVVDLFIGSNERLESQRLTFRTLIGDAAKAEKLIANLRQEAAETPFEEADILEAGKRLLRSTGSNIELNRQLVKQAETLAALNPERTVTDAAEAILDAQLGEFERLKEFSIKLSKKDVDRMKKSGEQLGDTAVRAINERIVKLGATNLVTELGQSVRGKRSTLIDSFRKTFQEVGEQAFEEVGKGIDSLQGELDKLRTDPQFREDMREVSKLVADAAKLAFNLARDLPGAVRAVRDFVRENRTALELGAGLFAANKLTGGALASGAFAVGRRALFGKGGGAAGAAAGALGGEGSPVFVTNWPVGLGGAGGGDFFGRKLAGKGAAGGGALTAAELATTKAGVGGGLVGAIGVGGVLGGAAILGSFGLGLKALADATAGTQAALQAQEARLNAGPGGSVKARADRAVRESEAERRRSRTLGVREALDAGLLGGSADLGDVKARTLAALKSGATPEDINAELGGYGLEVDKRGRFRQSRDVSSRLKQLTEFDKQLQANPDAAQKLFEEGKLDAVIAEAEGLKRVSDRAGALVGKLNKVDVSKVELNVYLSGGAGDSGQQAVGAVKAQKANLEKLLTDLTVQADQNGGG